MSNFLARRSKIHTRSGRYRHAVDKFLSWCTDQGHELKTIGPAVIGGYIRKLPGAKPTKKLHLAAIRNFFDKPVVRHAVVLNPALSVRGPRYSQREGKTPALAAHKQARELLESIDTSHVVGLQDRVVLGTFTFTSVRANAVANLRRKDYYSDGNQCWLHFDEKGGKARTIPVRYELQLFIDAYIVAAGLSDAEGDAPLFRTAVRKTKTLTNRPLTTKDIPCMVKRRLVDAGLPARQLTTHSFRATVISPQHRLTFRSVRSVRGRCPDMR